MDGRVNLLTVAIPCYNAEDYMRRAIDSALSCPGGIEVIIVDDGSCDNTALIADEYAAKRPEIVRVIHQANKGHGGAIMTGLRHANGLYFKVLDADDWLDAAAFPRLMAALETMSAPSAQVDMVVSNYVYDNINKKKKQVIGYKGTLPVGRTFGWDDVGRFRLGRYILMHSVVYRTDLLREADLRLPENTYYVDNLYVYCPVPFVKRMYYLDEVVYHYFIGRANQSVCETVMIKRVDQQLVVNRLMMQAINLQSLGHKRMRQYLSRYLEIITAVSSVLLILSGSLSDLEKKKRLWREIKRDCPAVWRSFRYHPVSVAVRFHGPLGRAAVLGVYAIAKKRYGFNA